MSVRCVRTNLSMLSIAAGGLLLSGSVFAHPGHDAGMLSGFLHPLLGLDHLIAMLAVGIWASQQA